ncbi:hypothetical protein D3C80_1047890 [compost metagenome]
MHSTCSTAWPTAGLAGTTPGTNPRPCRVRPSTTHARHRRRCRIGAPTGTPIRPWCLCCFTARTCRPPTRPLSMPSANACNWPGSTRCRSPLPASRSRGAWRRSKTGSTTPAPRSSSIPQASRNRARTYRTCDPFAVTSRCFRPSAPRTTSPVGRPASKGSVPATWRCTSPCRSSMAASSPARSVSRTWPGAASAASRMWCAIARTWSAWTSSPNWHGAGANWPACPTDRSV